MTLEGAIAIVTGASHNQGIGTAICRKLAREGANIFFTHWGSEENWAMNFEDGIIQENGVRCGNSEIDLSEPNAPFKILDMTSGQALGPMTDELAYVATKGAISAFTLSLSAELAPLGITVNAINPGPTDTGWMTADIKNHLTSKFLSGRIGLPEDAARLVSFLASEEAQWITGQIINSEGGFFRA